MSEIEVFDDSETDNENCTEENFQQQLQTFDDLVSERNPYHDQVCDQQVIDEPGPSTIQSSTEEQHSSVLEENANINGNDEENIPLIHRLHPLDSSLEEFQGIYFS